MINKYRRLIKDTFVFAIGGIGSKLILFLLVPLYTNFLSKEEYGVADLIFTISQFIVPIAALVIYDAVMRFGLSKDERKEDVLRCSLVVFLFGTIATIVLTPLMGLYEPIAKWRWYLCIYVIVTIFLYIEMNYIKAKEQNGLYATMAIVHTLSMAIFNIFFIVVLPLGIEGYILANIIANFISAVGYFFFGKVYVGIKQGKFSSILFKKMLVFSAPLILNNVSWWGINSANKIIVELTLGAAVLGIYTVATKIPSLINVLISIFQQSWGISSVKEIESSNDSKFYSNILHTFSFVVFLTSIGLILVIKPAMKIYVGESFVEAWQYTPLLLASAAFSALSTYFGSFYSALKKSLNNMLTTLLGAGICVLTTMLLIKHVGLWAAILGTFLSYFVMCIVRMIDVARFVKIKINLLNLTANSIILIGEAVLASLEIHIYLVSTIALALFLIVNYKQIVYFAKKAKKYARKIQFFVRDRLINTKYRQRLNNTEFSIISNDCIGGVICKDLGCRFNSPTVNFYFTAEDYIKFISRMKEYVENGVLRDVTAGNDYIKVAIEIADEQIIAHCIHYKTAEDFIEKWNSRKTRINYDNCFFMMNDRNGFMEEHLRAFDSLPYKHKVCFVHKPYPEYASAFYIKGSEKNGMVKGMTDYKNKLGIKRRYDDFDFVAWLNSEI